MREHDGNFVVDEVRVSGTMLGPRLGLVIDMLKELGFKMKVPTRLYMDNESAILLVERNGSFARNKNVMTRRSYTREAIQERIVEPVHTATRKMVACVRRSRHRDYCSRT